MRNSRFFGGLLLLILWMLSLTVPIGAVPRVEVVMGSAAPDLERFAASELCDYLAKLYGIQSFPSRNFSPDARAIFLIGSPGTNSNVTRSLANRPFPTVSDQGIVLWRTEYEGCPALVVGGGSPRATMWAVYELAERWGVRHLVDRDVLPEPSEQFEVPELSVVMEPLLRVRAHPTIQDFANSGESWGMADFRPLIDQLAKLKFTRANIFPFAYQPYLDWGAKGVRRRAAWLWYDFHYPITPDMVGRQLFGQATEFWNPDLPYEAGFEQLVAAGERQIHNLIEHAHRRGMDCNVYADLTQFPPEFAPLMKGAQKVQQVGGLTVVPGAETALDDPQYRDLCAAVLEATVNTYPETDMVTIGMPEWRQWTRVFEDAWRTLDTRYGIGKVAALQDVLNAAEHRKWPRPDGAEKALNEVKGDLASLVFYDDLLRSSEIFRDKLHPDIKLMCWGPAEELWPLLGKVLRSGTEVGVMPDNFQTDLLQRREIFKQFPSQEVPGVLDLTLDDDNIGLVPQMNLQRTHELVTILQQNKWAGFVARERFPGDHDLPLVYLAQAAWDAKATPTSVARWLFTGVCGEGCVDDMVQALYGVEAATAVFERNDFSFSFPVPGMMAKYWKPGPVPEYLKEARQKYQNALDATRRAQAKAMPFGRSYLEFWVGRLEFAIGYLKTVEFVRAAATAEAARQSKEAQKETQNALTALRQALEAYVRVARNRTDVGAIAVVNEYGYRFLEDKFVEWRKTQ